MVENTARIFSANAERFSAKAEDRKKKWRGAVQFNFHDGNRFVRTSSRCVPIFISNRILTILLHLCCRSAPPRLAHASTFKLSVLSCDFHAENWCFSCKLLYKLKFFRTCHLFLSFSRKRISPFKSDSACAEKSQKCWIFYFRGINISCKCWH